MRVGCEKLGSPVWRIRLSAHEGSRRIALDPSGLQQLLDLVESAAADPSCRVLVIQGEQGTFCEGMDLEVARAQAGEAAAAGLRLYARCMARLAGLAKPTLCAIDGNAFGGGIGLAAATDCVLATRRSRFGLPELGLGLIPAMVLPLLQRRMPEQKARWFALSGHPLAAPQAAAIGLVDDLVDEPADLDRALHARIKDLLRLSPGAIERLAGFEAAIRGCSLVDALDAGSEQTAADLEDPQTLAAIDALAAGELPAWFSRYKPSER